MDWIVKRFVSWLINNSGREDMRDVYAYSIECILNISITFSCLLFISAILGKACNILIWFIFFLPLRHTTGGIHASSRIACFMISMAIGIGSILIAPILSGYNGFIIVGIIFNILIVFLLAPVIHHNHPVPKQRIQKIKKTARVIVLIETGLLIIFVINDYYNAAFTAMIAMLAATVSTLLGYMEQKYKIKCK